MLHPALRLGGLPALVAIVVLSSFCSVPPDPRPNILLLVVDTLRADRLGVYGGEEGLTPHIDAFAKGALVFSNSTSSSSHTIGTSPGLLAGLYPSEHGYSTYKIKISDDIETLAERLQSSGYETFAASANPHVSRKNGLAQGFDHFIGDQHWEDTDAASINEVFLHWLDNRKTRPFFALLWYIDPHVPLDPPSRFVSDHVPMELRHLIDRPTQVKVEQIETEDQRRVMVGLYNAEVQYFDEQLGELLDQLKARDVFDTAMIVLTSDHGEELGDTYRDGSRVFGHGASLTSGVLDVPLLIKLPGSSRSGRLEKVARSIDIMPTVLSVADPNSEHPGRNLLALGPDPLKGQPVLAELVSQQYGPYEMYSVQSSDSRMVQTRVFKDQQFDPPRVEFFDLRLGGSVETRIDPSSDVRTSLEGALVRYHDDLKSIPTQEAKRGKSEEQGILERLRALGYVE